MPYTYGIKNIYRPTMLASRAYAWSTRPQYQRADVPTGLMGQNQVTPDPAVLLQQFAYEWLASGELGNNYNLCNPPFVSGAAGRLHPSLKDSETGLPARILRGFIRRADYEAGDSLAKARLYFMYNPETITRDYVSYLNQAALDPFNTVYESGNLVAPPSFMDFSFSLFFDRQEEAAQANHPGVFVDYQFFDLVVRNVVPTDPNWNGPAVIPDNGVMMVNPQDITVVFSPQLTVQGRPLNAAVSFERFTHRMTPTRMTIKLTMRVIYMGPMRDAVEYTKEQLAAEAQIPLNETKPHTFPISWLEQEEDSRSWWQKIGSGILKGMVPVVGPIWGLPDVAGGIWDAGEGLVNAIQGSSGDANYGVRVSALDWAMRNVNQGGSGQLGDNTWTDYEGATSGAKRYNLPHSADCSGLVTEAYIKVGVAKEMGWESHPGTASIISMARSKRTTCLFEPLSTFNWRYQPNKSMAQQSLLPGDILIRDGHIVFFVMYETNGNIIIFDASGPKSRPEVGQRTWSGLGGKTWYLIRPTPIASTSGGALSSVWNGPR